MFKHEDGSTWAMMVNRDLRRANSVALKLDSSITSVQEMSPKTGVMRILSAKAPGMGYNVSASAEARV